MLSPIANHLWQSTLFASVVALLTFALHKNQARTRYWLWLIASAKFLLPFSVLIGLGQQIEWSSAPKAQQLTAVMGEISQPFTQEPFFALTVHNPALAQSSILPAILMAIWICGLVAVGISWWHRWRRVHAAIRAGSPLLMDIGLPVLSSPMLMEPGVFGLFHPVLLLPQGILNHLSAAQLDAVIAHEKCHVRRRDNLTAAIHMAVEAIFWFHPLVWWLGARLVEERERACDEEVLRLGNEPQIYAESILKTCQFYLESPLTCVSGITGADLKQRVIRIMTHGLEQKLDSWRKSLLAVAGLATLVGPVALGLLHAPTSHAQAQQSNTPPAPTFEVASVKPSRGVTGMLGLRFTGSRFTASNLTVNFLLQEAYRIKESQIVRAPEWVKFERYDIDAKIDEQAVEAMRTLSLDQRRERLSSMLQSMLADRFKLVLHHDSKELPVYALLVAKNGAKLRETTLRPEELTPKSQQFPPPPGQRGPPLRMMSPGQLTGMGVGTDAISELLSRLVGRVVLDQTGLQGNYDFSLQWTPEEGEGRSIQGGLGPNHDGLPPAGNGPTIFAALREQLGLRLEAQKQPLDVVVIDHIEQPSAN